MSDDVRAVQQAAEDRAGRAGVVIRDLTGAEGPAAVDLLGAIWRTNGRPNPMESSLLLALSYTGNYCAGAFDGSRMVGVCVGFFGEPLGQVLHSHIAGVHRDYFGRGIGAAIKLHQRAWCAERGLAEITWTYDPLAARNAWFNLGVLGGRVVQYLPDFYGEMDDGINAGQGSDRLLVHWSVLGDRAPAPGFGLDEDVFRVLTSDSAGEPIRGGSVPDRFDRAAIAVPRDIEDLRTGNAQLGRRWRTSVRRSFTELLDQGWQVVGFDRSGSYLLRRS